MWVALRSLAVLAACGCGRVAFDAITDGAACEGTACGLQCTTNCFPMTLYRDTTLVPDAGLTVAALPAGEVHLVFVDPRTGSVMWMYSDTTLRHWSVPVDLAVGALDREFSEIALIPHADGSLTALMLDQSASASTLYRRLIEPTTAGSWAPVEPIAVVPLPPTALPIYRFSAVADASGSGGLIALAPQGGDTQVNDVYVARSADRFTTLEGILTAGPWDLVATALAGTHFLEVRAAVDSLNVPWVVYHARAGSNDDAVLARPVGASWQRALPGWGDPWHYAIVVDQSDVLHVFLQQEGTAGNPQHATATAPNASSGAASIGTWDWTSLPVGAYLQSPVARERGALRVFWEDPEMSTIGSRDHDGTSFGPILPDVVGTVPATSTALTSALVAAPQMVNGTSHVLWRDATDLGGGVAEYALRYVPFTRCGGVTCAFDQACVATSCTAR